MADAGRWKYRWVHVLHSEQCKQLTWPRETTCCFKVGALLQAVFTTWPLRSVLSHLAWDRLVDSPDRLSFLTPGWCVLTWDGWGPGMATSPLVLNSSSYSTTPPPQAQARPQFNRSQKATCRVLLVNVLHLRLTLRLRLARVETRTVFGRGGTMSRALIISIQELKPRAPRRLIS
ncbi:uncharacterized protein LY79DRAFT_287293 [Colletotrichum navitas]|uniref:Uncharacterized protein n=1 Tax=Colletotrichum navitas TaxID=681940 RepID=A0AAD8QAD1_9PEZI|nr:uncharacterized protein LY79DRAFT_287293 [Colletotrichum navitas]KAK1598376.1 hypothetical protein LY79DRAFT_287293 [Colletotrichum navitas]